MSIPLSPMTKVPLTGQARKNAINSSGAIHKDVAQVLSWLVVGLAICMVILRLYIRLKARRKLFLDDYFVLIAMVMMIGSAYIFHAVSDAIYLYRALQSPDSAVVFDMSEIRMLLPVSSYTLAFVETSWTSIFCVKFSFLTLFHTLIRNLSLGLTRYYWGVVAFTVLTWAFMLCESPILCSHFGTESLKCQNENGLQWTALTALVTFLDVCTDLLVVSFPILILRRSLMDSRQKFWIRFFLSLSGFMIIIALIRVLGGIRPGETQLDATWQLLWQLLEACVAVMTASATAMRSAFVRKEAHEYTPDPPRKDFLPRDFSLLMPTVSNHGDEESNIPRIPLAVVKKDEMTGISGITKWKMNSSTRTGSDGESMIASSS